MLLRNWPGWIEVGMEGLAREALPFVGLLGGEGPTGAKAQLETVWEDILIKAQQTELRRERDSKCIIVPERIQGNTVFTRF